MDKIYDMFLENGIINKEEYENINKEKMILNTQANLFDKNMNDFLKSTDEILNQRIEAENCMLKEIQEMLESDAFKRYYKKNRQYGEDNLQELMNNTIFIGEGTKRLELIKKKLESVIKNQLELEDKVIDKLMKDIDDYHEEEKEMVKHYFNEGEFRIIIGE